MGGGGFTMEPQNPALDDYILSLSPKPVPRVLFLPTASGDPGHQIAQFIGSFGHKPCEPAHLSLFRLGANPVDLDELLLAQDIIYVGGGSMRNLLAIWQAHGIDRLLRACWEQGTVLAGLSAGAMCWMEWGVSKSGGPPQPVAGLGFVGGSLTVHYDGEPDRRPAYLASVADGTVPDGWAADDGVGLVFRDQEMVGAVSSRAGGRAFRVQRVIDEAVERPLAVDFLGGRVPNPGDGSDDVREFRDAWLRSSGR